MLQAIMDSYAIFWVMGAVIVIDIAANMVHAVALARLVKAASRMGKSTHKLMKLVKAKFEHTYMLSNGVDNTTAFVDKYLHEYKIFGFRLQKWRSFEKKTLWICGALGIAGAAFSFYLGDEQEMIFQYLAIGATGVVFLFLIHISSDERYQLRMARIYMIDYLQNICAPRYEKQQKLKLRRMETVVEEAIDVEAKEEEITEEKPKEPENIEIKEAEKKEPEIAKEPAKGLMKELKPDKEEKVPQEVILREILEEFLA